MTKKRRHHYVSRYYLRPWAYNDKIWCRMGGVPFCSNLMGVAQRRDFYKLKELTLEDIRFLDAFINKIESDFLMEINKGWVYSFNMLFEFQKYLDSNEIHEEQVRAHLDELKHNLEENLHTAIEESGKPYLEDILQENISFFRTEKGCMDFIYYLSVQYVRTERQKQKTIAALNMVPNSFGVKFERIWNVITHIIATNVGWNLYALRENYQMILLKNNSSLEYITSDQPVINTYSSGLKDEAPEWIDMYYPVSPNLAVYLTDRPEWKNLERVELAESDVDRFNIMIVEKMNKQLFASQKVSLLRYALGNENECQD